MLESTPRRFPTRWLERKSDAAQISLAEAVHDGLKRPPKTLPSRFFYDDLGSKLFEEICELPEYYLTRAEAEILDFAAPDLAARLPQIRTLIELGSGSATKTETLLDAFQTGGRSLRYVPIDVSRSAIEASVTRLELQHPELEILAAVAEYQPGLDALAEIDLGPKLLLWLGSSIGNLERAAAHGFMAGVRAQMQPDDRFLLGVDLRKDRETLERAYDDAQGVTARFNLNLLTRINSELAGEFDLDQFAHRVHYEEKSGSVQSFLESEVDQSVRIGALDRDFDFKRNERIHTEDSFKYSPAELDGLAAAAGMKIEHQYSDHARRFSLSLLAPS